MGICMSDTEAIDLLAHLREGFLDDMPSRVSQIEDEVMSSKDTNTFDEH